MAFQMDHTFAPMKLFSLAFTTIKAVAFISVDGIVPDHEPQKGALPRKA